MKAYGRWSEVQAKLDLEARVDQKFKDFVDKRTSAGGYNDMYMFCTLVDYVIKDNKIAYAFADTTTGSESQHTDDVYFGVYSPAGFSKESKLRVGTIGELKITNFTEAKKWYIIKVDYTKSGPKYPYASISEKTERYISKKHG